MDKKEEIIQKVREKTKELIKKFGAKDALGYMLQYLDELEDLPKCLLRVSGRALACPYCKKVVTEPEGMQLVEENLEADIPEAYFGPSDWERGDK